MAQWCFFSAVTLYNSRRLGVLGTLYESPVNLSEGSKGQQIHEGIKICLFPSGSRRSGNSVDVFIRAWCVCVSPVLDGFPALMSNGQLLRERTHMKARGFLTSVCEDRWARDRNGSRGDRSAPASGPALGSGTSQAAPAAAPSSGRGARRGSA